MTNALLQPHITVTTYRDKKFTIDGHIKKTHSNRVTGISSEVQPFRSLDDIRKIIHYFDEHSKDDRYEGTSDRNKLFFIMGINLGIRISDLSSLKWNFILNKNGTFKDSYRFQPKKTRKTGKYVTLYFNDAVKSAVKDYASKHDINYDDYIFKSRQGNNHLTSSQLWNVIDKTAKEVGITYNVGTHSLRKTFGYFVYQNSKDKTAAVILLQSIFNHSSAAVTLRYIGVTDEDIKEAFDGVNIGMNIM